MPESNPNKAALKANAAQMAKILDAGGVAMQGVGLPELLSLKAGQQVGARRFTLVKPLGRGGMGVVWLAQDTRLDEPVALKFLPPEIASDPAALNDLRRETVRSHHLTHPNIIRIHDFQQADDVAFISMEYVDGATLSEWRLQQTLQLLSWKQLAPLVQQLCAALEYAHGENVIHRDLKPSNMMVDSKGRLKLADFGIAAVVSDSVSRVSVQHATSGTPPYMSPQQLAGKRPQVTDDIYALGATLYELLTGKPPFYTGDITHQVINQTPEPMEERLAALGIDNEIPPAVGAMVMACLAKEPGQRPQSARAVAEWIGLESEVRHSAESVAAALFPPGPPIPAAAAGGPGGKGNFTPEANQHVVSGLLPDPGYGRKLTAIGIVVLVMAAAFWLRKDIFRRESSKAPVAVQHLTQIAPSSASNAPLLGTDSRDSAPHQAIPPGMAFIPAGEFIMGDSLDGESDASPTSVTVSAFYMDVNLVSYSQWQPVYDWAISHGYSFKNAGSGEAANHPVLSLDWYDVVKWSNARSQKAGLIPVYYTDAKLTQVYTTAEVTPYANWKANGWRLPTEAEWEKAARGGLVGQRFPWGDTISESQANYAASKKFSYDLGPLGGSAAFHLRGGLYTSPVGFFAPNGYGLFDMAGNEWEWCWDWYGTPYGQPTASNPTGPSSGTARVLRGGDGENLAHNLRCAVRNYNKPADVTNPPKDGGSVFGGFRCVTGI